MLKFTLTYRYQAAKRAWRIGQTQECRLFYIAYEGTMQYDMSKIIAAKNRANAAISGGDGSGLSAMLGDEGDLRSLLLKSIKEGDTLKGSSEEWIAETSDRARELLANIGKTDVKKAPQRAAVIEAEFTEVREEESAATIKEPIAYEDTADSAVVGEVIDLWNLPQETSKEQPLVAESNVVSLAEHKKKSTPPKNKPKETIEHITDLFDYLEDGIIALEKIPPKKERMAKSVSVGQLAFDF